MKKIDFPMLMLAILVILMFIGASIGISLQNIWMVIGLILLGFIFMGVGISIKQKRNK
ncbi:thiol:disulfide interchange protein [Cerasibacillus quisquiliarum]|uniref:Uncharacterized protein n=1 Tax=Cerasibacillus quisquiliarum TaxID=227865 RepID=A0A511UUQ6_9BACI|nr:DUF5325 family protein [Cerasibacillus quisquiliarum]MBB5145733.1 thiol:disulfide interchange protein [Cerasibacillus quisquiliarum]GEN30304.1 hypothetical protein CQU01_05420 [Cerasibacillus quisquiliarum]